LTLRPPQCHESLRFYTAALAVRPLNPYLTYLVGTDLFYTNSDSEAVAELSKAIELKPDLLDAWQTRGLVYYNLKQWDKAIADCDKVLELFPKDTWALGQRAYCQTNLKQWDKALADYDKVLELDPKNAWHWSNRAHHFAQMKEWDKAIADLSKAIELDAKNATRHNTLAWLLATHANPQARDPGRAVILAKKAVELAPWEANYRNTLGVAHYRAGEWKAALAALEKSMELHKGGDSSDWFFVAMSHAKLGDKEKARQWYERATRGMDKNQPTAEELRRFRSEAAEVLGVDKKKD
jgi:tetratricopeptide (TPR) repeat protein